jgi:NAD(P)-dependent dehydrogenase (short-subunit alcohol dehydrogenase family)
MKDMQGKVALITGGSSGVGAAAGFVFAKRGAKVVLAARRAKEGEAAAQAVREAGGEAIFVHADVSDAAQARAMVEAAVARFGRLDYAFNNAGIEGVVARTADCTLENWNQTMAVNLKGVWLCMKYEIAQMLKQGRPESVFSLPTRGGRVQDGGEVSPPPQSSPPSTSSGQALKGEEVFRRSRPLSSEPTTSSCAIVNMSSGNGIFGGAGLPAYVATRHAVVGLTKSAALEYADKGIRINSVCPGSIRTPMHYRLYGLTKPQAEADQVIGDMHPAGRIALPEEVAEAAAWLCSEAASYVNGHALLMDGGWGAR